VSLFALGFAVFRRRVRYERGKQFSRRSGYFLNRRFESLNICGRRFIKPADFPDKLNRRRSHFFNIRGRLEIM
jgi:hypothetical protein